MKNTKKKKIHLFKVDGKHTTIEKQVFRKALK